MSCKNICIKFQADTLGPNKGHYTSHRKRYTTCYIFINWDGSRCHVATLHLEQDHALEDSKKYQGCRNGSQGSCRFRTLLKSLTVLTPQNDVRQVLSDSYSKTPAGKKS